MDNYELEAAELQKQGDEAQAKKQKLAMIGAMADAIGGSGNSYGNFLTGHMNTDRSGASDYTKLLANNIEDPWERRKQLLADIQAKKNLAKSDREEKELADAKDPNSEKSKTLFAQNSSLDPKLAKALDGMSYEDQQNYLSNPLLKSQLEMRRDQQKEMLDRGTKLAVAGQKAPKGMTWSIDPETGEKTMVADTSNLKPTQYQAGNYATRLSQAESAFGDLSKKGYDPTTVGSQLQRSSFFPDLLMSEDAKLQDQAERNFVNAVLRRESGAAISSSEFDSAKKQYFPSSGDSPDVLKQKAANRKAALASMKAEAGPALGVVSNQMAALPDAPVRKVQGGKSSIVNSAVADDQAGPHGSAVIQNGHTYVWNPKTGKYE